MGDKGTKATASGAQVAASVVLDLQPIGAVSARSMFGGHGIFIEDTMFAILDSDGRFYLRADEQSAPGFEEAGSSRHARMPYWEVPAAVREDEQRLVEWASTAASVAVAAKKR